MASLGKSTLSRGISKYFRFMRFAAVGTVGFCVDAGTLELLFFFANWHIFSARVISFLLAALTTWILNRYWTFNVATSPSRKEWALYTLGMSLGAAVNFGTFALAVSLLQAVAKWPALGVAIGSVCGMLFNYATMGYLFATKLRPPDQQIQS